MAGSQCVTIRLNADGYEPQESQRNVHVEERPPCGQTKVFTFTVYNDSPFTATVDIGMITFDVPADWTVTTIPSDTLELEPFSEGVVTVLVTIPCPPTLQALHAVQEMVSLQAGAGSASIIDVEGYIKGRLVGGIEIQFEGDGRQILYLPLIMR